MLLVKADCEVLESDIRHRAVLISPRCLGTHLHVVVDKISFSFCLFGLKCRKEKQNNTSQ